MRAIGAAMRVEVRRRKDIVIDGSVIDKSSSCFLAKYEGGVIGMLCSHVEQPQLKNCEVVEMEWQWKRSSDDIVMLLYFRRP